MTLLVASEAGRAVLVASEAGRAVLVASEAGRAVLVASEAGRACRHPCAVHRTRDAQRGLVSAPGVHQAFPAEVLVAAAAATVPRFGDVPDAALHRQISVVHNRRLSPRKADHVCLFRPLRVAA
jgi:hypothetical protein